MNLVRWVAWAEDDQWYKDDYVCDQELRVQRLQRWLIDYVCVQDPCPATPKMINWLCLCPGTPYPATSKMIISVTRNSLSSDSKDD